MPLLDPSVSREERIALANRLLGTSVDTREQAVAALLASDDPWLRSCGAYAVGMLKLTSLEHELICLARVEDPLLRETVRAAKLRLAGRDRSCHRRPSPTPRKASMSGTRNRRAWVWVSARSRWLLRRSGRVPAVPGERALPWPVGGGFPRDDREGGAVNVIGLLEAHLDVAESEVGEGIEERLSIEPAGRAPGAAAERGAIPIRLIGVGMDRVLEAENRAANGRLEAGSDVGPSGEGRLVEIVGPEIDRLAGPRQQRHQLDRLGEMVQDATRDADVGGEAVRLAEVADEVAQQKARARQAQDLLDHEAPQVGVGMGLDGRNGTGAPAFEQVGMRAFEGASVSVLSQIKLVHDVAYTGPRQVDVVGAFLSVVGMGGVVLGILDQQTDELAALLPDENAEDDAAHPDHREERANDVDLPRPCVGDVVDELDLDSTTAITTTSSPNPHATRYSSSRSHRSRSTPAAIAAEAPTSA